ncbi:MAG: hypothetical protein OEY93_01810 [Anaerolineae bacterium]|nr:hypothetical protein [Anaerolineae bacterium]
MSSYISILLYCIGIIFLMFAFPILMKNIVVKKKIKQRKILDLTATHLRIKHPGLFLKISGILYETDPMSFGEGCPTDEYDPGAGTIFPQLVKCKNESAVYRLIVSEFTHWFGMRPTRKNTKQAAKKIWQLWQNSLKQP